MDVKHEVALAFRITSANDSDNASVIPTLDQATRALPKGRVKTHAYDKAVDDKKVHEGLAQRSIKPLIQLRALANGAQMEEPILGRGGAPTPFVHDEAGTPLSKTSLLRHREQSPRASSGGVLGLRRDARHAEVPLSRGGRQVRVPVIQAVQRRQQVRPHDSHQVREGPPAVSANSARDEDLRTSRS